MKQLGLDIGSTTLKYVLLDEENQLLSCKYQRHGAKIGEKLDEILCQFETDYPGEELILTVSGSAGLGLSESLDLPFVQEVFAEKIAAQRFCPGTDVIIELGGEDAKILFLTGGFEMRMNGTCAGGTGAFIDQMAVLLDVTPSELDELAQGAERIYTIASRRGVFAKWDIQPLLNEGARKEDVAASIFQAVVNQTIAGLAQGREVKGDVLFLGGPLFFFKGLQKRFQETLKLDDAHAHFPALAPYAIAAGAAEYAGGTQKTYTVDSLLAALEKAADAPVVANYLPPLFEDEQQYEEFKNRHAMHDVMTQNVTMYEGDAYLGIDCGSTTTKLVLIGADDQILFHHYQSNKGNPADVIREQLTKLYELCGDRVHIVSSAVTGYGEALIQNAFGVDFGLVETVAHFRAARHFCPDVDFIIDIGGQDMKCFKIRNKCIDNISLNEACSSGCGSFIETFARSMGYSIEEFCKLGLFAKHPIDLGSRCTVFMNSSVKQAQKDGAPVEAISAGLSISVVKNALYKVIRAASAADLGERIVVQGGTFLNDAVLRAFELLTEREVTRPNIAGLMGAYGAALTARMHYTDIADGLDDGDADADGGKTVDIDGVTHTASSIVSGSDLDNLSMTTERDVCKLCQNHCKLTITTFQDGSRYVTGNRCERGGDSKKQRSDRPNLYDYKYKRCFAYRRLTDKAATRGEIGIPRALNMYENYPFWFTLLTTLGFKVMISGRSSHELFETGIESIASENICYPAKLVHGHIKWLLNKGIKTIFYPCVSYEENFVPNTDNHYNCPVVANYPVVIGANMPELREEGVRYMRPYFNMANHELMVDRIVEEFAWANVTREEAETAVKAAYAENEVFKHDVQMEGLKALAARINAFAVSEDLPAHGECVLSRFVKDPYDKATLREQEKEAGLR